ncbi:hemerythrin domain-containing protein [Mycobacterium sp. TNTM28]|uniref:Hemerythrin domain-containing protein n=1 Tax=[Mycobacterium] fortunisiensis TaxID=2600579 RepID=A0ABS6KS69_9MYCO|nr:hemerythrin domain-containing protein [[Mycobacterium] fortunisiensis]MBU9766469.1 hemerythrin domain-containing protein [[Mycobacterium] fortunisiensis]
MSTSVSPTLEHEHRLIDAGIIDFADADPRAVNPTALLEAIAVLRRHIYLEEEYLFPPLRAAGLVGPIMVMVREHGLMWPLLDRIEQAAAAGDTGTAGQLCRDLLEQLNSHNMKEERILYPQADALPPGDLDELAGLLSTAELPAGWVCGGVAVD